MISRALNSLLPTSRDVKLLLLAGFFLGFGFMGFGLILNLYFKALGYEEGIIGNFISARSMATMAIAIPAAFLARRLRLKPMLITSSLVTTGAALLVVIRPEVAPIAIGLIVVGLFDSFGWIIRGPMIMKGTESQHQTRLFSIHSALMITSSIFGTLLAGALPDIFRKYGYNEIEGFRISLIVHIGIAFLAIFPVMFLHTRKVVDDHTEHFFHVKTSWLLILRLASPHVLVGLGAGMSIPFLNLYFRDIFNLTPFNLGILFSGSQALMITGTLIAPWFAGRWGRIKTVIVFQMLSVPFLFILSVSGNVWLSMSAFLARASLMNMAQPLVSNFSLEKTHEHDHPLMSSIMTVAWLASFGVTANIGGWLIEEFGYFWPLNLTLAAYVISSVMYFFILLPMDRNEPAACMTDPAE
jgi:predicted MFS family arabinose efflux permease